MDSKVNCFLVYLLFSCIAIYFIYSPAINIQFYHHDTYKYSTGGFNKACATNVGDGFMHNLSRPIAAYLDCLNYKVANTFEKMSFMRLMCALLIAVTMAALASWLYRMKLNAITAFFISGAIFCLPGIQTAMVMATTFIPFAALTAFLSNILISFSATQHWNKHEKSIIFILGIVLLFVSLFTYPSLSSFFLVPAFILILLNPLRTWERNRKIVLRDILIFVICTVLFFIIAKFKEYSVGAPGSAEYRYNPNITDIFHRIIILWQRAPELWSLFPNKVHSLIFYTLIFLGALSLLKRLEKKYKSYYVEKFIAFFLLLGLGSTVFLLQPEATFLARIVFVFQAMMVLVLTTSMSSISELLTDNKKKKIIGLIFSGFLFLVGALYANYNMITTAITCRLEFNFVVSNIAGYIHRYHLLPKRIHIIGPTAMNFTEFPVRDDIFNSNSTIDAGDISYIITAALLQFAPRNSFSWYNCILTEGNFIKAEVACIKTVSKDNIVLTYSKGSKPLHLTSGTLLIDMSILDILANDQKQKLAIQ